MVELAERNMRLSKKVKYNVWANRIERHVGVDHLDRLRRIAAEYVYMRSHEVPLGRVGL